MCAISPEISSVTMPCGISADEIPSTRKNTGVLCIKTCPSGVPILRNESSIKRSTSEGSTTRAWSPSVIVMSERTSFENDAGTVNAMSRILERDSCSAF